MNKKNKILIGCLALLLALSVGYALFSDTITINGTATAKGNFQLTTTCDMDVSGVAGFEEKGSVVDAKITCENNIVDASATLGYPGSAKWFRVMVKNTGTIPAKIKEVVELNDPDRRYFNLEEGWTFIDIENCNWDNESNKVCSILYPSADVWDDYRGEDLSAINGIEGDWNALLEEPVLDPGETAYFYVNMKWLSSSVTPGEPITASLNAKITWEQVTN